MHLDVAFAGSSLHVSGGIWRLRMQACTLYACMHSEVGKGREGAYRKLGIPRKENVMPINYANCINYEVGLDMSRDSRRMSRINKVQDLGSGYKQV